MKAINDVMLMYRRNMTHTLRNLVYVFVNLFMPMLYLFLFMPLLQNLGAVPGIPEGETVQVFIPGLLVMLGIFGPIFVGFNVIDDIRSGVIERFLVTPVNRSAILLGMILKDVTVYLAQCLIITLIAIPMGLKLNLLGFLLALPMYMLIAITMASLSYSLGLILKIEDSLAPALNMIAMPVMLLSGIMLPMILAPAWLQTLAKLNPLAYAVDASRMLFTGNYGNDVIIEGYVLMTVLAILMFKWATVSLGKMAE
ncbi:MAG: ABC transporter permease [Candidatus Altiarchaeia archaeon]